MLLSGYALRILLAARALLSWVVLRLIGTLQSVRETQDGYVWRPFLGSQGAHLGGTYGGDSHGCVPLSEYVWRPSHDSLGATVVCGMAHVWKQSLDSYLKAPS